MGAASSDSRRVVVANLRSEREGGVERLEMRDRHTRPRAPAHNGAEQLLHLGLRAALLEVALQTALDNHVWPHHRGLAPGDHLLRDRRALGGGNRDEFVY